MDISPETALTSIRNIFANYKNFVQQNPLIASELESALRWISYIITGICESFVKTQHLIDWSFIPTATKLNNNHVISELLYSCSSLLTLFNDTILRKSYNIKINVVSTGHLKSNVTL